MAHPSEIKKLEQRYRENPKGRNFAPLADAYRKAGLLDHAIELCQSGLQRHPDYVSAHIVYGRCLIDQKNDPAAIEAFRRVLALDSENVLALKMLAEIGRDHCTSRRVVSRPRIKSYETNAKQRGVNRGGRLLCNFWYLLLLKRSSFVRA